MSPEQQRREQPILSSCLIDMPRALADVNSGRNGLLPQPKFVSTAAISDIDLPAIFAVMRGCAPNTGSPSLRVAHHGVGDVDELNEIENGEEFDLEPEVVMQNYGGHALALEGRQSEASISLRSRQPFF